MNKPQKKGIVPALRFPEFQDAGEWEEKNLGEVATFFKGKGLPKSLITPNGKNPCIHYGELFTQYSEVIRTVKSRTDLDEDFFLSIENDVLMPTSDVTPTGLAKACCIKLSDVVLGGDTLVIRTNKRNVDGEFLARHIRYLEQKVLQLVSGSTVFHLYATSIEKLSLSVPKRQEQQKIADCLSSIDDLITAQTQKLTALKAHKKGLMQQLFPAKGETVPRLRFPEFRDAGEWKEVRLKELCDRIMDGTHFSPKTKDGTRMYLTSKNIQDGKIILSNASYISEEEHKTIYDKCPVKINDVLLTKDGANTGNCALNTIDSEFSLLSSVAVLRGKPSLIDQRFLYQVILSDKTQRIIKESMSGQAITRITLDKIGNFLISIPDQKERQKIADCLSSIDELITAQSQKIDALKLHKKGLMQQLFPSMDEVDA